MQINILETIVAMFKVIIGLMVITSIFLIPLIFIVPLTIMAAAKMMVTVSFATFFILIVPLWIVNILGYGSYSQPGNTK